MDMRMLASLTETCHSIWTYLYAPIQSTQWHDWLGFWAGEVLDDRYLVAYFLPLLPILLLLRRDRLRVGIILTGVVFLAYVFGPLYPAFWLLTCLALHRLSERFAIECKRTDVLKIGPPLAAISIVGCWYLATMLLHQVSLPTGLNALLHTNLPWLYPLGARGASWEPVFRHLHRVPGADTPFPLIRAIFSNAHAIGTAYLAARMLHYFSEIKRETIPRQRRTLLNFLAYTCYAPTLIQGPIERFTPFQDEMDTCHERRGWRSLPRATWRIGLGLAKCLIATWYFHPLFWDVFGLGHANTYYAHPEQIESFWLLYFGVFFQIFGLYLEFSGYCDVTAGIAHLLGYRQVENFNMPWLATSMRDYWRRWHISLSFILRDYVYIALGGNRKRTVLNLCITFFLCGIWHDLAFKVAVWGVVMGLMVAINQYWARWIKQLDQQPTSSLAAFVRGWRKCRPLPQVCAWLLTQHAFVFSLLIFFGGSGAIKVAWEIIRRMWGWLA